MGMQPRRSALFLPGNKAASWDKVGKGGFGLWSCSGREAGHGPLQALASSPGKRDSGARSWASSDGGEPGGRGRPDSCAAPAGRAPRTLCSVPGQRPGEQVTSRRSEAGLA